MNLDQRASGVLLHITSLPGPNGIGDFGPDAYRFVDWLAAAGQRLWQWLPTTPVGPGDSPYQSPSAFAGSPLMVALEPLVERGWLAAPTLPEVGFASDRVKFSRVIPWRDGQLRAAAAAGFAARAARARNRPLALRAVVLGRTMRRAQTLRQRTRHRADRRHPDLCCRQQRRRLVAARPVRTRRRQPAHRDCRRAARRTRPRWPALGQPALPVGPHGH